MKDCNSLHCPKCGHDRAKVIDTRHEPSYTRRRRECLACRTRFTTRETVLCPNSMGLSFTIDAAGVPLPALAKQILTAPEGSPVLVALGERAYSFLPNDRHAAAQALFLAHFSVLNNLTKPTSCPK